jgi:hypothetical protein
MNNRLFILPTLGTGPPARALALQPGRGLRRDDVLGRTIGFLLVGIPWLADAKLRLQPARLQQPLHPLVAEISLKLEKRIGDRRRSRLGTERREPIIPACDCPCG